MPSLSGTLPNTSSAQLHAAVSDLLRQVGPSFSQPERDFAQLVGLHETSYGRGWKPPGAGSHNMGAITGEGPAGFFEYHDSRAGKDGKVIDYVTKFRKYPDDASGLADLLNQVLKSNVRAAIQAGSMGKAVAAMYANKYFLGVKPYPSPAVPQGYMAALQKLLPGVENATGHTIALQDAHRPVDEQEMAQNFSIVTGNQPITPQPVVHPTPAAPEHYVLVKADDPSHAIASNTFDPASGQWVGWKT